MTVDQLISDLLESLHGDRRHWRTHGRAPEAIHDWLDGLDPAEITGELLYALGARVRGWEDGDLQTPAELADFVARLAASHRPSSVLDPTCGNGLLLSAVAEVTDGDVVHGIDINRGRADVAKRLLGGRGSIVQGDAFGPHDVLLPQYDLIVADPPFGVPLRPGQIIPGLPSQKRYDFDHALVVWAAGRLTENGVALVIVTPRFLVGQRAAEMRRAINALGASVAAAIHLPPGTFHRTGIDTYLVVIRRGDQDDAFVAQYHKDSEHQTQLIENLLRRRSGPRAALGVLTPLDTFRGMDALVADERLRRLVRGTGWIGRPATDVFSNCERLKPSDLGSSEHGPRSLFLRSWGRISATTELSNLVGSGGKAPTYVLHLHVSPEVADPRFMVHWFNESQVGEATLAPTGIDPRSHLTCDHLSSLEIYLPPLDEQRAMIRGAAELHRIRAEASELEGALWGGAGEDIHDLVRAISTINREDRYEDWIDTLPFPLASILWRHHASQASFRERFGTLLHFFEATAAFLATLHLSAFRSSRELWEQHRGKLSEKLSKERLSPRRATFGFWKLVAEYLSAKAAKLLATENGVDSCQRIYGTANTSTLRTITDSGLRSVLQRANKVRNDWRGHAGAISEDKAQEVNDLLMELVQELRGIVGRVWLNYELIQPGDGRYKGGVHHVRVRRLMGTRSNPFEQVIKESNGPLEAEALYLFDSLSRTGLQLLPFIKVMPSPERQANACFIFNRVERGGSRFVSYHFEQESEFTRDLPEVAEALTLFDREDEGEA